MVHLPGGGTYLLRVGTGRQRQMISPCRCGPGRSPATRVNQPANQLTSCRVSGSDKIYGVRIKVSEYARGAGTDLPRRRLTPAPCWVHPRDMCACTRPAAGWIAQRARSVPAPRVVRRSTAAPNNVRKTRSSSDDLLLLLGRQLLAVRSIVSSIVMVLEVALS